MWLTLESLPPLSLPPFYFFFLLSDEHLSAGMVFISPPTQENPDRPAGLCLPWSKVYLNLGIQAKFPGRSSGQWVGSVCPSGPLTSMKNLPGQCFP